MLEMKGDYIMKKSKLLIALITPLILSGCGSKKLSFQEDLKYERELTISEIATVQRKALENMFESLKSIKSTFNEKSIEGHEEQTSEASSEITLYSDLYARLVSKSKETDKNNGVAITTPTEEIEEIFDYPDRSSITYYSEYKVNNELDSAGFDYYDYLAVEADQIRADFYESIIYDRHLNPFDNGGTAYLAKDGSYAFVNSIIEEDFDYIGYDSGIKEFKSVYKSQNIVKVDKNYKVTSVSYYTDYSANRDEITNEWFKDMKSLYHVEGTATFSYGKRVESGKLLSKAMDKVAGAYLFQPTITFEYGKYNAETGEYTKTNNVSKSTDYHLYQYSTYSFKMSAHADLYDDNNALKFELVGQTISAFSAEQEPEQLKAYYNFDFETVELADGSIIMLVPEEATYMFALDLIISIENRALVLDVKDVVTAANKY